MCQNYRSDTRKDENSITSNISNFEFSYYDEEYQEDNDHNILIVEDYIEGEHDSEIWSIPV